MTTYLLTLEMYKTGNIEGAYNLFLTDETVHNRVEMPAFCKFMDRAIAQEAEEARVNAAYVYRG